MPFSRPSIARSWRSAVAVALVLLVAACTPAKAPDGAAEAPPLFAVAPWELPAPAGSAQPDLAVTPAGALLLSWLEPAGEGRLRFRFSRWETGSASGRWTPPATIAEGDDFFRNWADTPHVFALEDGALWAHWLRSTGPDPMDYGIALVRSDDDGRTWSASQPVHPATRGDHGFVTFWPQARDRVGVAWLDSRQKAAAGHAGHAAGGHDHAGGAPMMLRAALYDSQAAQQAEWPLDASTCDCCTTASAVTDRGVVVVYRGRGDGEIRDTRLVRFDGTVWTAPRDVHADGWRIAGCPVNGPVVAAQGGTVWVAWYTEAGGEPELRAARSDDAGDTFAAPVTLARGPQVLGRLALAAGGGRLWAAWLEQGEDGAQRLVFTGYDPHWGEAKRIDVATLGARGRASGLPRLQWSAGAAWLAWTDVADGAPVLRGARIEAR